MRSLCTVFVLLSVGALLQQGHAQTMPRADVIWARSTNGQAITLDGVLDEPAWALAESKTLVYGHDAGIPGSGWKVEAGVETSDTVRATLRFLVDGNQLYIGAVIYDKSIGGGTADWARWDALMISIKNHASPNRPAPPDEYFYTWWYPQATAAGAPGQLPRFVGKWAQFDIANPRTAEMIANWDAVTTVQGLSNDDAVIDTSWTVEMRINLAPEGYDVTKPAGDIVEFNVAVWDCDWNWPTDPLRQSTDRVWWQGPWSADSWYDVVRIYARPDITLNSALPPSSPEYIVPDGRNFPDPAIDGSLTESVWTMPSTRIKYGDDALRASYPGIGAYRSGQFQPALNSVTAQVLDPLDATVRMFFKGNFLYVAADVNDQVVQSSSEFDRWDGFRLTLNTRFARNADSTLDTKELVVRMGPDGKAVLDGYLPFLRDSLQGAEAALALKPGTTVDNPNDVDAGYTLELKVDLTKFGYPDGLGDHLIFPGFTFFDGDSFVNPADDYGTRTWWYRERAGTAGPPWGYMDVNTLVTGIESHPDAVVSDFRLLGNHPNPFNPATRIGFALPASADVRLDVYDMLGRTIVSRHLGTLPAGTHEVPFDATDRNSTGYVYRVTMTSPATGARLADLTGKMMLVK